MIANPLKVEDVISELSMTYVVSDGLSSHRSKSKNGVRVMIIEGDFLNTPE